MAYSPTPRELEVLRLIALGFSEKEVAGRLSISQHTVRSHLARVRLHTGCMRKVEMTLFAVQHHLISRDEIDAQLQVLAQRAERMPL